MSPADPFEVARIRRAVLAAWSDLPSRFTEDLNSERDFGAVAYRDRLLVELAQNASDAAGPARDGCLRLQLDTAGPQGPTLSAHNTGLPLSRDGVVALASLRASGKGDGDVGRFGVGFTAVLGVSDAPQVHSSIGSVGFSRQLTLDAVHAIPALAEPLARAGGEVPVLRLPFAVEPAVVPEGFVTSVVLPLRPDAAATVAEQVRELARRPEPLLLGLPGLARLEVVVDGVVVHAAGDDYLVSEHDGVTWAVPPDGRWPQDPADAVLFAPTPTEEPVTLPALLIAPVALEPGRRHVVRSAAAQELARRAGTAYGRFLAELAAAGRDVEPLLPDGPGQGWFDNLVRQAARETVPELHLLPSLATPGTLLAAADATTIVDGSDLGEHHWHLLAGVEPGLVRTTALTRALGVRGVELGELVDRLVAGPEGWVERVAPLLELTAEVHRREDLATLGVPLASGGVARGARGVLLPEGKLPDGLLQAVGTTLRLAHPVVVEAAGDPTLRRGLERLGAVSAGPSNLLRHRGIVDLVLDIADRAADADPDAADIAGSEAVLDLVAAAWREEPWGEGRLDWLRDLLLPDEVGEWVPAWSLVQPDSVVASWLDEDEVALIHPEVHARLPVDAWRAMGVADRPLLRPVTDLDPEAVPDELAEFDGVAQWLRWSARRAAEQVGEPARIADGTVLVRDLDLFEPRRVAHWLASRDAAEVRAAIVTPTRWVGPDGVVDLPGHPAWWLGRALGVCGAVESDSRFAGALPVVPDEVAGLDDALLTALGVVRRLQEVAPADVLIALGHLTDPSPATLLDLWAVAATASPATDPDDTVWAMSGDGSPVRVAADDAVVIDAPHWLQRDDLGCFVLAPAGSADALADALDLDLATDRAAGVVTTAGQDTDVPASLCALFGELPRWRRHERLLVDGVQVAWWIDDDGLVHAATVTALAHALAWRCGRWPWRHAAAATVAGDDAAGRLLLDAAFAAPDAGV